MGTSRRYLRVLRRYDRVTCSTSYIHIEHGITWHTAGELRYMVLYMVLYMHDHLVQPARAV